ncbi:hypothetical protein Tco_1297118, partial [Tanacetum coccineum]
CGFSLSNGTCINCTYGDGKPVTCCECESPLNGGFCLFCNSRAGNSFTYDSTPNSFDNPPNFSYPPPQPQYDTYFCELCGNDAHYGYDCPLGSLLSTIWTRVSIKTLILFHKLHQLFHNNIFGDSLDVQIISNPEPCYNQNVDEFPQTLPSFHPTCYSGDENSFTYDSNLNFVVDSLNPPPQPQTYSYEFCGNDAHYGHDCPPQHASREKQHKPEDIQELLRKLLKDVQIISEELADYINTPNWNCPAFYEDDDYEEESSIPLKDKISELPLSVAIIPFLSTEEPDNSLNQSEIFFNPNDDYASSDDDPLYSEDINYIDASPPDSELVGLEEIEALKDNPTPSTDYVLNSPSLFHNSFLKETDTSDNSLPESKIFCFDMEEKSSGNPTSYSDLSLPDYEAFYYDNELDS